ncbi:tRNA (adenosine(37)-N6)-threonylcarbamoyltransferase complex dimerization subunit type 1 TsaB [Corynebacterium sp. 3HC-13]|uniref:tRNA (adenosine(37)-N6)-threonylcarbamoyltransferase complex dimerization subunit type 1 TsaB n=1 Tax=Corynebacterium poyangense TaxID=2684405 RepID=UPI001CCF457A|nr:tRNA (adenosine(37)-N6)-threonylcarbamoyltransferase complex dimerization subunit type 1 TsaB [Corynebacterium poyangense]MBZ8176772.1 tRNA (adenosine(37)-N6)-threonylcarbamoyltransferase complex dimerization subunit type 1 TsaB [Corynebacterium poyangense]
MLILALDSATPDVVVGVVRRDGDASVDLVDEEVIKGARHHNELLVPTTHNVLRRSHCSFSDLDAIVVGIGPGPFTGLRVGMATAQAFGDALSIPVYGVCSLDAIAVNLRDSITYTPESRFLVATDARRKEVYWATYSATERLRGPQVTKPHEVEIPSDLRALSIPQHLVDQVVSPDISVTRFDLIPTPTSLVRSVDLKKPPQPLTPLYLRRPDAHVPAFKPLSPAIPRPTS